MKKVNADLLRVRTNRDSFQKKVEVFLAQEAKEKEYVKQTQTLANSRNERIKTLESELKRLKVCMAGNSGELGLVEFFKHSETENPYQSLSSKLQQSIKENSELQEIISSINSDSVF
jgi:E3 ubiquitin-protein ligase BRE1